MVGAGEVVGAGGVVEASVQEAGGLGGLVGRAWPPACTLDSSSIILTCSSSEISCSWEEAPPAPAPSKDSPVPPASSSQGPPAPSAQPSAPGGEQASNLETSSNLLSCSSSEISSRPSVREDCDIVISDEVKIMAKISVSVSLS